MAELGIISEVKRKMDFEWKIMDFFSLNKQNSVLISPEFHELNSTWAIIMYPNGRTSDFSEDFVGLHLFHVIGLIPVTLDFVIGIKNVNDLIVNNAKFSWKSDSILGWNSTVGWNDFILRSELHMDKQNLVPSGNLTLRCTLIVKDKEQEFATNLNTLADDFTELWRSKKNSDMSFMINGEAILAHKAILAARSSVFAEVFENEKKSFQIFGCRCALEIFLEYLYSGTVKFGNCDAAHVYNIADNFDIEELRSMCVDFMIRNLSVENVCKRFVFSCEFKEKKLQSFIQHFFYKNFEKIVFSDDWKTLIEKNSTIANELLKRMASQVNVV